MRAHVSGVAGGLGQGRAQVDGSNAREGAESDDDAPHVVQVVDVCTGKERHISARYERHISAPHGWTR